MKPKVGQAVIKNVVPCDTIQRTMFVSRKREYLFRLARVVILIFSKQKEKM